MRYCVWYQDCTVQHCCRNFKGVSYEFDYDNGIHEISFEVSSVAATMLNSGWPPLYILCGTRRREHVTLNSNMLSGC